jgi:hypothetical protein
LEPPVSALERIQPPTVPTVEDMGPGDPDRVVSRGCGLRRLVALYGWVLVPFAALERGGPVGDPGSLDPSGNI